MKCLVKLEVIFSWPKKDYDKKRKLDKVCACCSLLRSNFMLFIT